MVSGPSARRCAPSPPPAPTCAPRRSTAHRCSPTAAQRRQRPPARAPASSRSPRRRRPRARRPDERRDSAVRGQPVAPADLATPASTAATPPPLPTRARPPARPATGAGARRRASASAGRAMNPAPAHLESKLRRSGTSPSARSPGHVLRARCSASAWAKFLCPLDGAVRRAQRRLRRRAAAAAGASWPPDRLRPVAGSLRGAIGWRRREGRFVPGAGQTAPATRSERDSGPRARRR